MYWANFLHFYQPFDQQKDVLDAVVAQCYRPLFSGFATYSDLRLTINISGALLELLDHEGHRDLIDFLRAAGEKGTIEFTSSAKYHAFLPFLKEEEIIRQVKNNDDTCRFFLGSSYKPLGFFPPEMAYSLGLERIVEGLGFKWMILDEIAMDGKADHQMASTQFVPEGSNLRVFFRQRRLSNVIMSAVVRTQGRLAEVLADDLPKSAYVVTGMDGETFGHHRPGMETLLFDLLRSPDVSYVTVSDLISNFPKETKIKLVESTWASSPSDVEKGIQFLSWSDPSNFIHKLQKKLLDMAREEFAAVSKEDADFKKYQENFDKCLSSDHFWWASAKPWWSLEMIEQGAWRLLSFLREIPGVSESALSKAAKIYEEIVSTAFEWQRSGKIRAMARSRDEALRIPFKERTAEAGGGQPGIYRAFMAMMRELEEKAAEAKHYEEAILWRDAIYKIENKLDIYETVHAIDLVRLKIPHDQVEAMLDKYTEKYKSIRGGQPEQRG